MPSTLPRLACLGALLALAACGSPPADESAEPTVSRLEPATDTAAAVAGQTIYVPVYSHIYTQDGRRDIGLAATLSVRNTDPERAIKVEAVDYYDSAGQLVRRYAEAPFRLGPLASHAFVVEERDRAGGVGANLLMVWTASAAVSPPIAEAVMVSTASGQGISLVSRGHAVRTLGGGLPDPPKSP